jgi:hypothetical protein
MAEALAYMEQSKKRKCINAELMEGTMKEFPRHDQGLANGSTWRGEMLCHLPLGCQHKLSCYRQPCRKQHGRRTGPGTLPPTWAQGWMCNSCNQRPSMTALHVQAEQDPPAHSLWGANPCAKICPSRTPSLMCFPPPHPRNERTQGAQEWVEHQSRACGRTLPPTSPIA